MILMMLPSFASVKYDEMPRSVRLVLSRVGLVSIFSNWLLGPLLMLGLGLAVLHQHGDFLQGVIFVGAARCIAMVLMWNALAGGDALLGVSLVLLNSVITVFAYAPEVSLMGAVARVAGVQVTSEVQFMSVLSNVLVYLCIPLALGLVMWLTGHKHPAYE